MVLLHWNTLPFINADGSTARNQPALMSGRDRAVAKYNSSGHFQWAFRIQNNQQVYVACGGTARDIYIGNRIAGNTTAVFNSTNNNAQTINTIYHSAIMVKYNSAGVYQWHALSDCGYVCFMAGVAVDSQDSGYLYGSYNRISSTSNNINVRDATGALFVTYNSAQFDATFCAKYLPNGAVSWVSRFDDTGNDAPYSITIDRNDNIYMLYGAYGTTKIFHGNGSLAQTLSVSATYGTLLTRFTTSGTWLWTVRTQSSTTTTTGSSLAVDSGGNIVIVGQATGVSQIFNTSNVAIGTTRYAGGNTNDGYALKFSSSGQFLWQTILSGGGHDHFDYVACDSQNNVYIAGRYASANMTLIVNNGSRPISGIAANGSFDSILIKYDAAGNYMWHRLMVGTLEERSYGLAVDSADSIVWMGNTDSANPSLRHMDGSGIPLVPAMAATRDYFFIKTTPGPIDICPAGTRRAANWECVECAIGTFQPSTGSTTCLTCPAKTTTLATRSMNATQCVCSPGHFLSAGVCTECGFGKICAGAANAPVDCGSNSNTTGVTSSAASQCLCNAGFYGSNGLCSGCPTNSTSTTGSTTVSQCSCIVGFFGTSGSCQQCPLNSFCTAGATSHSPCGANMITLATGSTSSSQCICDSGFTRDGSGNCVACGPFAYKSTPGDGACQSCPSNSVCTTMAWQCDAGFSVSGSTCAACALGSFKPSAGNSTCTPCGSYATCTTTTRTCNAGATFDAATQQCVFCQTGTFKSASGNGACTVCSTGSYCQAGSTTDAMCPAGSFCASTSNIQVCAIGDYCLSGSVSPTPCPVNSGTLTTESTSLDACICDSGFYGSSGSCNACPAGVNCPRNTTVQPAQAAHVSTTTETQSTSTTTASVAVAETTSAQSAPTSTTIASVAVAETTSAQSTPTPTTTASVAAAETSSSQSVPTSTRTASVAVAETSLSQSTATPTASEAVAETNSAQSTPTATATETVAPMPSTPEPTPKSPADNPQPDLDMLQSFIEQNMTAIKVVGVIMGVGVVMVGMKRWFGGTRGNRIQPSRSPLSYNVTVQGGGQFYVQNPPYHGFDYRANP